jgi:hypothetical protein
MRGVGVAAANFPATEIDGTQCQKSRNAVVAPATRQNLDRFATLSWRLTGAEA